MLNQGQLGSKRCTPPPT